MRKIKKPLILLVLFGSIISFFLYSCNDDFDFDKFVETEFFETDNPSEDFYIDGVVAVPVLDTRLTLSNLIPKSDSSLWAEVDENSLVHLRSYYKDFVVLKLSDIYPNITSQGTNIPISSEALQTDTAKLKVYDHALSGHLFFKNPSFTFKFTNEIPILTYFKLDTITFHNIANTEDSVSHTDHNNYTINAPVAQGTTAETDIIVDKTVIPEFPEIFSPIPKYVSYYLTVGNLVEQSLPWDMTGDETLKIDVDIDLPLDARLEDFELGDTVPFDLVENYDFVQSVELRIEIDNGFPVEALSQITFMDSAKTFTEDLFAERWHFEAGDVNSSGEVISSNVSRISVTIDQEQFKRLKDNKVDKFVYSSILNSNDAQQGQYIKIFSYYQMGVKIGVKAEYEIELADTAQIQ